MSIHSVLSRLVDREVLWCVEPFEGDRAVRSVLVSGGLNAIFSLASRESRIGRLLANFQDVVSGGDIYMSFVPYKHRKATFGVLDPVAECTWEYRSRDPEPGLRVFGRFADVDTFVAVDWWPRSRPLEGFDKTPLGDRNSIEYQFALISVDEFWVNHLAAVPPVSGATGSDYFTDRCFDAGVAW